MKIIKFDKFTTTFELKLLDDISLEEEEILSFIDRFEARFSRFVSFSEISVLNKNKKIPGSEEFRELLDLTLKVNKFTSGYFNPFVDIDSIGYSKERKENKKPLLIDKNLEELIKISDEEIEINPDLSLDLGGIAKGFLVDKLVKYIRKKGGENFYVNFGGDIFLSGKNYDENWKISLENPFNNEQSLGNIELLNNSISTSGTYKRNWLKNGEKFHHIINPKTQKNEEEIIMVSVIGKNTYFSDSIATSVLNMGIQKGINFLHKNGIDALIIGNDKNMYFTDGFTSKYKFNG